MGLFNRNDAGVLTPRQQLETKISNARSNLLLVVIFTIVNIVLAVTNSDTYFLFSAAVPYYIVNFGMVLCGKYPAEFYEGEFSGETFGNGVFVAFVTVAVVLTLVYLLAWNLSKDKKKGWLIFALVFFAVDTLLMFLLFGVIIENIIDIAFHIWVIVSLSMGISASAKLAQLPEEDERISEENETLQTTEPQFATVTAFKRVADTEVKHRVLCEAEFEGHKIVYRRVKKVNELVIDGYVYDEYEALLEFAHELSAEICGHKITAGFDGATKSYIDVDGQRIAKKIRLY